MKALQITHPGHIELIDQPVPLPKQDEILLRIRYVGFCGSDRSTYLGKNPMVSYPRIPGHEVSAIIEKTGIRVPGTFSKGQLATVIPYSHCGLCASCFRHRYNACQNNQTLGVQRDGAMTEYITMPYEKVLVEEGITELDLALVEPLTVGFHAVARGRVKKEDTVMVIGCGMIGLGAIIDTLQRGARVIAVDIDDTKLNLVRSFGVDTTLNVNSPGFHQVLLDNTNGRGPDVVIEAVGHPGTYKMAIDVVAFTGHVVCIGYAKEDTPLATKQWVQKELDILGSRNAEPGDFESVIRYMKNHRFPSDQIISQIIPPEKARESLEEWTATPGPVRKIVVQF